MSLLNRPNLLSSLIVAGILTIALSYGYCTMQIMPDRTSFASNEEGAFVPPYNFDEPDQIIRLPNDLKEISGLELGDSGELLCIQDEDGKIFILNLATESVTSSHRFAKNRDYEGIARVGDRVFVLERDGDLHHFDFGQRQDAYESEKIETGFSYRNDTEGLCYDALNEQLLIAPKAQNLNAAPERSHIRSIYSYKIGHESVDQEPVFSIDEYELGQLVYGERTRYTFRPSAIGIHPNNEHIYLLSAVGESLLIVDRNGDVVLLKRLDDSLFPQPEGIAFDEHSNLIISTEGQGDRAIVAVFEHQISD
ncbi:MAG: SdiA-regulated domain-containing protein [Bacteroidota bacterium]